MRALILTLFLTGCSIFGPVEPLGTATTPAGEAQLAVNEANLALTAVANTITANVKDGIWTKDQARPYLNQVKDYAVQADRAQELIRLGEFAKGKTQAEATKALITVLHREIAAQARREK